MGVIGSRLSSGPEAPNFTNSYSNQLVLFANEKLCKDALVAMRSEFKNAPGSNAKVTLQGVCFQRKTGGKAE
jgi:hypothetical protein